ncbi:insulinase family protein [Microvirga sp. SRT01]|uniref:Insulinase family protein n=1 Tax=Sphingomonas longa TaxID=2778730 RepID=A0ABS2D3N6_9SPHN|nr:MULTISPECIES: insulinase family protein [Alphaproteobacteria]MBM6575524.1 insulinase family protein [Sphingomonas sp. BT552]MBR7708572.1 insulinase family protein [Microvirga sp. SRT01]
MAFPTRVFRVSALAVAFLTAPLSAQQKAPTAAPAAVNPSTPAVPVDTAAWLYKGSDIAPDPAWSFGTLPNGLRYAVRKNGVPPGQVAVRVAMDVGSLYETDSERGFAHFIEHLSFRSSAYVPDGEAKRVWQRLGATFGSDSNATTTPTQTLYKLDLPAATEQGLDESLHILSGMMAAPVLSDASVAAERPVVLAERREQPGPQVKFADALRETFYAGQPLAERSPIGTEKTLGAATGATVKAFHDRWYRPSRAVVIVSGDMDPALFARLIVKNFAGWQPIGPDVPAPDFGKPDPTKPATSSLVEPGMPAIVATAVLRPWKYQDDTILFNQKRMVDTVAARLVSRRLEQRARFGGSFLQAQVSVDDESRSANVTSTQIVPVTGQWEAALKDVRAVIADAMATAPTQVEIDRELADYDTVMRTIVETSRVEAGAKQADDMASALDIRETTTSPETSYAIFKDARAKTMFTPETVLASTRRIFQGDATRAIVTTPTADGGSTARLDAALKADVSGLIGKRRVQAAVTFDDLPKLGAPSAIVSRRTIEKLGLEQVDFANGVRLLIFANTGETGRVYVRTRFGSGYAALPTDRPSNAWAADLALVAMGVGKLDQGDLEQLSAGRRIGLDFGIDEDAFLLAAMTSPADYKDELRLMAAKLEYPRWDRAPILRAKAGALAAQATASSSPTGVLQRDLEGLLRDGDPRWATPTPEQIDALTRRKFRKLWKPLMKSGAIELSVFGDVKVDEVIAAAQASFGAMKPRQPVPLEKPPVRFPAHVATPVTLTHDGPATQAAAVIAWPTGGGIAEVRTSRQLDILAQVFGDRLFERLRQTAGASYSPSVQSQWPVGRLTGGRIMAIGQVEPDKVDLFFRLSREIAADLVKTPIAADELERIVGPMKQQLMRASTSSQFWLSQMGGGAYDPRRISAVRTVLADLVQATPADLQSVAARYLRPDRDWTLAVVPKGGGVVAAPTPPVSVAPSRTAD